jgi:hypothetical protein
MTSFFRFFAERHLLANLITLMTVLLGLSTLTHIKRDIWPEVDYGWMIVTTRYPGASPEDVELNVTNKLEEELKQVAGIGGSDPYMAPMVLALAYGVLFATPITLILVPCLRTVREDIGILLKRLRGMSKDSRKVLPAAAHESYIE